jgi:hypothetical protein
MEIQRGKRWREMKSIKQEISYVHMVLILCFTHMFRESLFYGCVSFVETNPSSI